MRKGFILFFGEVRVNQIEDVGLIDLSLSVGKLILTFFSLLLLYYIHPSSIN